MKTNLFLIFFVIIPAILTGQTTTVLPAKSNVAGYNGIIYDAGQPTDYQYQKQLGNWYLGNFQNNSGYNKNGRGYLEFDLTNIPSNATITVANLKLYVGFTTQTSEAFVVRNLSSAITLIGNGGTYDEYSAYVAYGLGTGSFTIDDVRSLDTKTLDIKTQVSANKGNKLYLCLIHSTENTLTRGLYLNDVKLEITYTQSAIIQPPAPPTLTVSNLTSTDCKLTWTKPTGAVGYQVYQEVGGVSTSIGYITNSSTTFKDVTGRNPSSIYGYYVKAYNFDNDGWSQYSGNSNKVYVKGAEIVHLLTGTISTNTTVTFNGDIYVQNVTVTNNAKLTFNATGGVIIDDEINIQTGSEVEIL